MVESPLVRALLRAATALVLAFIYLPLIILAVYAFNESKLAAWPPTGFTLDWFGEAAANPAIRTALLNSLVAATAATLIALVLGTLAALAVQRYDFFGKNTVSFLFVLPIALPGVVTGIALQSSFKLFGVGLGLPTIIIAHATFCVVVAYNNIVARLRRLPRSPEEASADLGADSWMTFRRITLPGVRTALLSGGLLAFALSFDEVIVTLFAAGAGTKTIPVWIFNAMQRPNELPVVNVVALLLVLISVIPVWIAQRLSGGEIARGGR
ncbi:MAG: ABC transporter permease [Chloroflexi bacterium]|jgi:putative spermidine/putrescine transport system permease protein|nr:ABC transporter permease [Chloroflexota bacterium]